jgi:hypothetical protein
MGSTTTKTRDVLSSGSSSHLHFVAWHFSPLLSSGVERIVLVAYAAHLHSTCVTKRAICTTRVPGRTTQPWTKQNDTTLGYTKDVQTNDDSGSQPKAWDTPGHGLAADQAGIASTRLGRRRSPFRLVQHCSALGLRLYTWEWDQDIGRRGSLMRARCFTRLSV